MMLITKLCASFQNYQPVLTTLSLIFTPWDALMWIPSVLGLTAGDVTIRWKVITLRQLVNAMCIF